VKSVPQDVVVVNMMLIIVLVVQVLELQPQPVLVQLHFTKKLIILVNHVIMNVLLVKEIG
jgi:type IV secretory pathway VirB3-like protein